jgi:PTS system nitrogen regulatory IIA component
MRLLDILTPDRVLADLEASDRDQALDRLVGLLVAGSGLDPSDRQRVLQSLIQRERVGSTGIGQGVAIPHAKVAGLTKVVAGFARSPGGVEFGALDGQAVHLFLVLVAPEGRASLHLKALARASRMLRDERFRAGLLELDTAPAIYESLAERDRSLTT